jgi:hypothetical protein
MLSALLWLALGLAPPETGIELEITARDLDPAAIERGVAARLGTPPDGWHIAAEPGLTSNAVHVRLSHVDGREIERDIELEQVEIEARSRELATALALLVEQSEAEPPPPEPPPPEPPPPEPPPPEPIPQPPPDRPRTTGWIGALGHVGLNARAPISPDYGAGLAGGVWLDELHLQPVAQVAWSHAAGGDLRVDAVRFGAGLLAGSALVDGRLWVGGGAIGHAMWAIARAQSEARGWVSVTQLVASVELRGAFWMIGARVGVDLVLPPLTAHGNTGSRRFDAARPAFGLLLGVRLPPRRPSSGR